MSQGHSHEGDEEGLSLEDGTSRGRGTKPVSEKEATGQLNGEALLQQQKDIFLTPTFRAHLHCRETCQE